MAYAWHQVASTNSVQHSQSAWQIYIYQWRNTTPTPVTVKLASDISLKRGSANHTNKVIHISVTQASFLVKDTAGTLFGLMAEASDSDFKAVIKKDGSTWFTGNLVLLTTSKDFTFTNQIISFRMYDGLQRLSRFKDVSALTMGRVKVKDLLLEILNALNFEINIKIYQNMYKGATENGGAYPNESNYVYTEDYVAVNSSASYYDILLMMCKQFGWEIFQDEGVWIVRQIVSMKYVVSAPTDNIIEVTVTYSTGAVSKTTLNKNLSLTSADIQFQKNSFKYARYNEARISTACFEPKSLANRYGRRIYLGWVNPFFQQGSSGWTVNIGTANFGNGTLQIEPTGEVVQTSGALSASDEVTISFSVTCVRMVLNALQMLDHTTAHENPLLRITYVEEDTTVHYLHRELLTWGTSETNYSKFGVGVFGVDVNGLFGEVYCTPTLKQEISVAVPAAAGVIKIYLYGGGTASGNNYPNETSAQHNYCVVEKKFTDVATVETPEKLLAAASFATNTNDAKILDMDMPFHDLDAFINVHHWYSEWDVGTGYEYIKMKKWATQLGDYPIIEALVMMTLQFHQKNHGLDLLLLPGTTMQYNRVVSGNIDGAGSRYYLPVYEESKLIADDRRFILLEHQRDTTLPTVTLEHQFNIPESSTVGN